MKTPICALLILLFFALVGSASAPSGEAALESQPAKFIIASRQRFAVGAAPGSLEVADLNRDGKPDLIVANEESGDVTILLATGKGGFKRAQGPPFAAGNFPNDIAVADFNGDGKLDLAFANHEALYLTILLGDGKGDFKPAPGSPLPAEMKPHVHGVAAADFNGDGAPDLVTESWEIDQIAVFWGDGRGRFDPSPMWLRVGRHPYQRLRSADVNGDGKADILTTNLRGDNLTVLLGNGKGEFQPAPASPFPCGIAPFFVGVGDLNGDAKPDLAVVNAPSISVGASSGSDGMTVLIGDGQGAFTISPGSPFPTGSGPTRLALGDLNGDGFADVAVTNLNSDNVSLFFLGPAGRLLYTATVPVGKQPKGIAIADLNRDRKADLAVTLSGENSVLVLFGK
ncbi:MAG: FG-GAP repeat domain-containing protein [Candidatus Acidiferrales bacterium]